MSSHEAFQDAERAFFELISSGFVVTDLPLPSACGLAPLSIRPKWPDKPFTLTNGPSHALFRQILSDGGKRDYPLAPLEPDYGPRQCIVIAATPAPP
ncbi:hypothetical protein EDC90_1004166 [Martelella mediterranea]|uniref:Uncharacterized protein n=1 Tax=Martelella mediterranea TaxID=293089 RepID=A0A4V2V4U8_9HYPH|nr:hypothetical protein EDC90_1004166 [Martelella mediterranea]